MQCEICGRESQRLSPIAPDGSRLMACEKCFQPNAITQPNKETKKRHEKPRHSILEIEDALTKNYGQIIRVARQKKGLTIEELAKTIFEKASFLHRVESQTAEPTIELVKKLEKALGIKLVEQGQGK